MQNTPACPSLPWMPYLRRVPCMPASHCTPWLPCTFGPTLSHLMDLNFGVCCGL